MIYQIHVMIYHRAPKLHDHVINGRRRDIELHAPVENVIQSFRSINVEVGMLNRLLAGHLGYNSMKKSQLVKLS